MKIRNRLSIYFAVTSALIMLVVLIAIYFLYQSNSRQDFFRALHDRALVTAHLYLEADEESTAAIEKIKDSSLLKLPGEIVRIYDSTNTPAFIKDPNHYYTDNTINITRQATYYQFMDGQRQDVGIYYTDNQGNFVILVSAIDEVARGREMDLLKIMGVLFIVQLLVVYFSGWLFAQKALQPIKKINQEVQTITATDLHYRVAEGRNADEIGELARNFNQLLQRLQLSFETQKTFIANASHELRTPLTSIIGELEVMLSQPRTAEEYRVVMGSILAEADKLTYIMQGLLELANAENKITQLAEEQVRPDELLWELQQQFARLTPPQKMIISMPGLDLDETDLEIKGNRQLLTLAIGNIVRNAFKFSYNQPVQAVLTAGKEKLQVSIIDKGIGIQREDIANIFEPFYRSTNGLPFEGHGLGLFIANRIITLHGGTIEVTPNPGEGTTFNICFTK